MNWLLARILLLSSQCLASIEVYSSGKNFINFHVFILQFELTLRNIICNILSEGASFIFTRTHRI